MENNEDLINNNNDKNKNEKKLKKKSITKKEKTRKIKTLKLLNDNNGIESEKNLENNNPNENNRNNNRKIIYQKETTESSSNKNKSSKIKKEFNYNKYFETSENLELKQKISEKNEKIKELSLSQEINKKSLTELLKKVSETIESNADILYSKKESQKKDLNEKEEIQILKLKQILEKKQKEYIIIKEINKKYKNKYESIIKDLNLSSIDLIENYHRRINALKENNNLLSKEINILTHKNNVDKKKGFNQKSKINIDIKKYSDEYISLMKEKYKQNNLLKNNKKLIKDVINQFQNLIQIINEKNINNEENNKEINNLKEDLSGDEENIYNKILADKTIILNNYSKTRVKSNNNILYINKNNSSKNIKLAPISRTKNIHEINKNLRNSKSCNNIANQNIDININDIDFNKVEYEEITNNDFAKITDKKQKYLNLAEKLDKSINDIMNNFDSKIKKINILLDLNSKKLSNIQQENELLQSKIADMRRIIELKKKENKIINENINKYNFEKQYENIIKKLNIAKMENTDIEKEKNNERDNYINMIKKRYKYKTKNGSNLNFSQNYNNVINSKSIF